MPKDLNRTGSSESTPSTEPILGSQDSENRTTGLRGWAKRLAVLVLFLAIATTGYWFLRDWLSLDYLATQESLLREYGQSHPIWAAVVVLAVYVAVTGFSLPGAVAMTLVCGWYFGFWQAMLIVSFGSTGGATLAFLMTRYLFQDWVQKKFERRIAAINEAFEREGAFYLFTLRLIPAVPFFVINAVMGLTKIRVATFWWVSQVGMLPGTAAYVYAGSTVPSLKQLAEGGVGQIVSWQLLLAFAILGLLPLGIKRVLTVFTKTSSPTPTPASKSSETNSAESSS